jgi:trans-feruloyl-CoA hydratase/vanillin synthase
MAVAKELASKDAHALKACKDGYRFGLEMSWEASMNYTAAKENEVFVAQKGAWVEAGIGDFVKGKYKPGLQGHEGVKSDGVKK